jgi:hypothetical protein
MDSQALFAYYKNRKEVTPVDTTNISWYVVSLSAIFTILVVRAFSWGLHKGKEVGKLSSLITYLIIVHGLIVSIMLVFDIYPLGGDVPTTIMLGGLMLGLWIAIIQKSPHGLQLINAIPAHWLMVPQVLRIVGGSFLAVYSAGLGSYYWAMTAGWGDILVGLSAAAVAWMVYKKMSGWQTAVWVWTVFSVTDIVNAAVAGAKSPPQSDLPTFVVSYVVPVSLLFSYMLIRRIANKQS